MKIDVIKQIVKEQETFKVINAEYLCGEEDLTNQYLELHKKGEELLKEINETDSKKIEHELRGKRREIIKEEEQMYETIKWVKK